MEKITELFENEKFAELVEDLRFIEYFLKSTYKDILNILNHTSITPTTRPKLIKIIKKITNKNEIKQYIEIFGKYGNYDSYYTKSNKLDLIGKLMRADDIFDSIKNIIHHRYNIKDTSKIFLV